MSMFKNLKTAQEMMKNMDPDDMKDLLEQARNSQGQMEETLRRIVREEIKNQNLVTKDELEKLIEGKPK